VDSQNTFLDALTCRGVLISVSVRYWRARKKLNPEDIGLNRGQVDDRLISLGHKRLVPKDCLKSLSLVEGRAHALVEESTFPFLNGVARYLPNTKLEEVTEKLRGLQGEFEMRRDEFLARYAETRRTALQVWRTAADELLDENQERLLAVISGAFPAADAMPRYFGFDIRTFQITAPDIPQAQLVEIGTQQELIAARKQAATSAQREIERSCREFIADSVAALREQTAKLCGEMLQTINGTGSVHQKTLNRLVTFIDRFRELNFANDTEMTDQLDRVREQFLQKTAAEYRDDNYARQQLVSGLSALRNKAAELVGEDARQLVENFGQMGRRRFTLAA
jgi:hypothetical protein